MYQSPIRLAGIHADKKELQLARKKLLAELELSGNATIPVNGKELGRQDINTLFDELADDEKREMHEAIYKQPVLLDFLETGKVTDAASLAYNGVPAAFRQYFSPIAGQAIHAFLQQSLRDETGSVYYTAVQNLANNLLPADADFAFQPTFRYYTVRSRMLEDLLVKVKDKVPVVLEDGIAWMTETRVALLNALPDLFSDLRYKIARDLNNISVALELNQQVEEAYQVIQKAAIIQTAAELMELIRGNVIIYRSMLDEGIYNDTPGNNTTGQKALAYTIKMMAYIALCVIVLSFVLSKIIGYLETPRDEAPLIVTPTEIYPMDEEQKFNNLAFMALKKSLIYLPSTDTPRITPIYAHLILPCDTCGDGFENVWKTFFKNNKSRQADTIRPAKIIFTNKLKDMDVFALINIDSRHFSSIYLRPGQTKSFEYRGIDGIGVSFYMGSNWNSESWHEALMPHAPDAPDRSCIIQGSFMNVPDESDYLKPEHDVFLRTQIMGKSYQDTIEIASGKDRKIEYLLGLDERD